ncbi:MAG: type II toxin-antitoxin system VapC family toxin [Rhodothermales bacterium]
MKKLVLDSFAVLAYFEREAGWEEVASLLAEAAAERVQLFMSVVNWGEVFYVVLRAYDRNQADLVITTIDRLPIEIEPVDRDLAFQAALFKAGGGLAYADCFAGALAARKDAELLTDDPEFRRIEDKIRVRWLTRMA